MDPEKRAAVISMFEEMQAKEARQTQSESPRIEFSGCTFVFCGPKDVAAILASLAGTRVPTSEN